MSAQHAGVPTRDRRGADRPSVRPGGPGSLVGVVLGGRYRVERLIGEGGMGAVYQAEHTHMRKRLAVKVLHPEMSRLPEVVARFEREAMAAGHMDHPNVAGATDFGKLDDGSFFLVLEYVEGQSLRDAIAKGRLELGRVLHIARQIASALARAHGLGIVHRDLKPENIMLVVRDGQPDFVKVLDFGIAKVPVGALAGAGDPSGAQALTQLGMVYGTPEYMAPEQALGQPVDARADLYALGVMTFEMIAGARPYSHESKVTLLGMHVTAPIPSLGERTPGGDVPPEVEAIVTRLLAKEAEARFTDARELIDALDTVCAQLISRGRIAVPSPPASFGQPAFAGGSRMSQPDGSLSASIALGPTRLAQRTPGPALRGLADTPGSARVAVASLAAWARPRRGWLVASGAGALLLVTALLAKGGGHGAAPPSSVPGGDGAGAAQAPREPEADTIVAAAQATIERGDYATAIDSLTGVEEKDPDRADVHRLLERAYTGVRNAREALREARLWLAADPNAVADLHLQEDVRNAALLKDVEDEAFALLEAKMGTVGVDILYDIAFGTSGRMYPQAAARARRTLEVAAVRARGSPALAVLLDFRDAKTCDEKHALLDRARDQGDRRLLPVLQALEATRGCGFLGRSDCYPCLHRDHQIIEATAAIEDRVRRERAAP